MVLVSTSHLQNKVTLAKIKQPFAAHFSQFQGQSAALHPEVIRKLLPGKGDIEFVFPQPLRFGGEIGQELCSRSALPHVRELFAETQVFLGEHTQQVADYTAMVRAGGRAHVQDALYIDIQRGDRRLGDHAHIQHRARGAGIGSSKGLSRSRFGQDVAIAPNVLLDDQNTARQHKTDRLCRIADTHQKGVLWEAFFPRIQTGEHSRELLFGNARKKLGGADDG